MRSCGRLWFTALFFSLSVFGQETSETRLETLAKGLGFAEGPAWSKDGYLVFSDTRSDRLMKWVPGHAVEPLRTDAHGPSGNAFDAQGRLYTCETRSRRVVRTERNGKIEVLAETWEGKRLNAPNGIVVGKTGHVYFTDPAFGSQADARELDFYGVYHIPPKGPMQLVAKTAGRPNGVALSPSGRTLYVVVSDEKAVRSIELDRDGNASSERVLISRIEGVPAGIAVDEKGNLYVAGTGISVYTPEGRRVSTIKTHERASNCAFGDVDLKSLFITSRGIVYRSRMTND